jgi:FkbM family methyltransferase
MHDIVRFVNAGDLVFDIGAHAGEKAAWFLQRGARVICVEPQPALVAHLNGRFANDENVVIVGKGVASAAGWAEMSINSAAPVLSTFSEQWKTGRFAGHKWDRKVEIELTTLDALIAYYGVPKYVKVDVEGFEKEVIGGLTQRCGILSFEFTGEFLSTAIEIITTLEYLGYKNYNVSLGEELNFSWESWMSRDAAQKKLADLTDSNLGIWGDIYAM